MVLSEDGGGGGDDDGQTERRFDALCLDLNMDRSSQEEAWQAFERITTNYTLEVITQTKAPHRFIKVNAQIRPTTFRSQ